MSIHKDESDNLLKNQKIIIYEEKIKELRQILLNSGFDKDKWGKYAVDIILVAAIVNMHIPKIELKKLKEIKIMIQIVLKLHY